MATVNKDFVVKNGVVAGANVQGVQLVSTTSSLPPLTVTSTASVANLNADLLDGQHGSYFLDFANATNIPDPVLTFTGDVTGSLTLTNLLNASATLTIAANSVALGTDTTGDYVATLSAGTGVSVGTATGEGSTPTISIGQSVATSASVTFATITLNDATPIVISSSALISNLNSQYLNGYTAAQLMSMSGVQSVIGTANEVEVSASTGNIQVGLPNNVNIAGSLTVGENFIVSGSVVTINSTVVTIDDPIFTLGGDTAPSIDDNKDRGIEFRYYNGSAKVGFFGYDDSTGKFTFIPDATNTSEVFSGTKGEIDASVDWSNILNKPDPVITLNGDVSGSGTLTDLASASITVTVEKDFSLTFVGDVTGTGTVSNLGSASITLSLPQSVDPSATPTFAGLDLPNGRITSPAVTVTANNTPTVIDTFATSAFTVAEYLVRAKQGSKMTATKVTVMWDGTDVLVSEYSIIDSAAGAANVTFTASESGGTISFTASSPDAASTNIVIKTVRTAIDA